MILSSAAEQDFKKHVLEQYPNEACGVIAKGQYFPCKNISPEPRHSFIRNPRDVLHALQVGPIEAVLHSHCYDKDEKFTNGYKPTWASKLDMESWIADNIPWGIVASDGEGTSEINWYDDNVVEPLERREYSWGNRDCYSIVRDWYRLNKGITLKNFARDWDWEKTGGDLFVENFEEAGFTPVPYEQADIGDVCLIRFQSKKINHCAIISNHNEILHQWIGHYARNSRLDKWQQSIAIVVRYVGNTNDKND